MLDLGTCGSLGRTPFLKPVSYSEQPRSLSDPKTVRRGGMQHTLRKRQLRFVVRRDIYNYMDENLQVEK